MTGTTTETAAERERQERLVTGVLGLIEAEVERTGASPGENHAGVWDQSDYIAPLDPDRWDEIGVDPIDDPVTACGATLCFAGHLVLAAGWVLERNPFWTVIGYVVNPATGEVASISDAAQRELGIDDHGAMALFSGGNDLHDLRAIVGAYLASERGSGLATARSECRRTRGEG